MAKLAATLFESKAIDDTSEYSDSRPFPKGTVCLLCGETLEAFGYDPRSWNSVAKWDAYAGIDVVQSVRALCAPCHRLVWLFEKKAQYDDAGKRLGFVSREKLGKGWHRAVAGKTDLEHYGPEDLKALRSSGADYWTLLEKTLFDPRAQMWVLLSKSTRLNLFPYLPYTPANSPYLHTYING